MTPRTVLSASMVIALAGSLAAQTADTRGAKELFYDPVSSSVTSASPSPKKQISGSAGSARSSRPQAAPVHLDARGRRQVNVPSDPAERRELKASGISCWIELQGPDGGPGIQADASRVFRSGERIRLHFRSNTDGHIAIVQLGSSGGGQVLFPDPGKGLADNRLTANEDRVLPTQDSWFRFDGNPGTEQLIVLFARSSQELERFPLKPQLDERETGVLMGSVQQAEGSKDLFIESETRNAGEVGTYGVNVSGQPVVLQINLQHR